MQSTARTEAGEAGVHAACLATAAHRCALEASRLKLRTAAQPATQASLVPVRHVILECHATTATASTAAGALGAPAAPPARVAR